MERRAGGIGTPLHLSNYLSLSDNKRFHIEHFSIYKASILSYNLSSHYSIIRTQFENIKSVIKVRQIDRSITRTYLRLNHLYSEQIENGQTPDKNRRIYKQQPIRRVGIDFPIRHILHLIQPAQRGIAICYVFIKRIISVQTRSVIFIASQMHNRFGVYFRHSALPIDQQTFICSNTLNPACNRLFMVCHFIDYMKQSSLNALINNHLHFLDFEQAQFAQSSCSECISCRKRKVIL